MTKGLGRSLQRGPKNEARIVKDTIDLAGKTVDIVSVGGAVGFGSLEISDFPEGNILVLGMAGTIGFAGSGANADLADTWAGNFGIGSTPASDATISTTDEDIVTEVDMADAVDEVVAPFRVADGKGVMLDNTDGSLELNLNVLIDAADIVDDKTVPLTLSGLLEISYIVLGND